MNSRGIRGAITICKNTASDIEEATVELLEDIFNKNDIKEENISHVIFTMTKDLNAAFPAKFAREHFCWKYVPMVCFNELDVEDAIKMCLRVLVVINTAKTPSEIKHSYLKGAQKLRPDII